MRIRNQSREKQHEISKKLLDTWWLEIVYKYDLIYSSTLEMTNYIDSNPEMFDNKRLYLFGTEEDYLRGQIERFGNEYNEIVKNNLFNMFLVNVYTVLDSCMEEIFKGFLRFSSEYHNQWSRFFNKRINKINNRKNKSVSVNVQRYNYFFKYDTALEMTDEEKNTYCQYSDSWKKTIEEFVKYDINQYLDVFEGIRIKDNWDIYEDLINFNGKFRQIRNNIVHQYFRRQNNELDKESFLEFMNTAARIVHAIHSQLIFMSSLSSHLDETSSNKEADND